jgi:hypothetical protein
MNICKCRKKKKKIDKNIELDKIIIDIKKESGLGVYLNIYHLTILNYFLQLLGFGFFHTSLEINDTEYSFKLCSGDESGIFFNRFKDGIDKKWLKEKIYLGKTSYDINSVNEIFKLHIPFWLGKSYDLFKKNCNHFTKFFACLLLRTEEVVNYPEYVNRITIFAQYFSGFYKPIKKLYFENNNSISSSINSEIMNNEAPDNNGTNNENNNGNNKPNNNNENNNENNNSVNNDGLNNDVNDNDDNNSGEKNDKNVNINVNVNQ